MAPEASKTITPKRASVTKTFGEGAPKCASCTKSVYPAEKVQANDQVWHKGCFCCGGTGNEGGCKKKLGLDSYLDHGSNPYCKQCHAKLFGPKGYGFSTSVATVTLSTAK
jgi:hypothetical protein